MNNSYRTTCTIKSNGDGAPKAWSAIRYTVTVNMPLEWGGGTTVDIDGVQSAIAKKDDPVDTEPAAVGSPHPCVITQGFLEAFIAEEYAMAECVSAGSSAASRFLPGGLPGLPPDTGGTGGNTAGTQGGQTGSGAGDGGVGVPP